MAKLTQAQIAEQTEARDKLRSILTPGTTVYTALRHVSSSGMYRAISAIVIVDGEPIDLDWLIVQAGLGKFDQRHAGIKAGGCGMNMGFNLVYSLSRALYPNGFACTGSTGWTPTYRKAKRPRCMSNDHVNGVNKPRRGLIHKGDGGYALNQAWL